jgi:5-methylcytosine-specific restriction endonuclease McrA
VIPLARGGHHVASNIRPAHRRCNLRKGSRLV